VTNHTFCYLGNKSWSQITREERSFCGELYKDIQANTKGFIEFINNNCNTQYNSNEDWEVGFEVCFYRDYLFSQNIHVKESEYSQKRTFDLCLFSNKDIIIIEAKAGQRFHKKQLNNLNNDVISIKEILKLNEYEINVFPLLLCSSLNKEEHGIKKISWENLYGSFNNNESYLRANKLPDIKVKNKFM
jgi:hypothetical protein